MFLAFGLLLVAGRLVVTTGIRVLACCCKAMPRVCLGTVDGRACAFAKGGKPSQPKPGQLRCSWCDPVALRRCCSEAAGRARLKQLLRGMADGVQQVALQRLDATVYDAHFEQEFGPQPPESDSAAGEDEEEEPISASASSSPTPVPAAAEDVVPPSTVAPAGAWARLPLDARVAILVFEDFYTLARCAAVASQFLAAGVAAHYGQHLEALHGAGFRPEDPDGRLAGAPSRLKETVRFLLVARQLHKDVGRPLAAIRGLEVTFPGMCEAAEVAVHLLGRRGVHNVSPAGARRLAGLRPGLQPARWEEHIAFDGSEADLLDALVQRNPGDDALHRAAVGPLRGGSWSFDFYPAAPGLEALDEAVAALYFDAFGVAGVLLFEEKFVEPGGLCPDW